MNLAQMRTMLRSILTAGGGANKTIGNDEFWSDKELNSYLNMAQGEIYKIIRRARSDYFTRVMRTTDAAFNVRGTQFTPSTLRWVPGQGNYQLPADFVRMKLITDLSSNPVTIRHADIARNEMKVLMNLGGGQSGGEYYYDIIGVRTLVVRPIPQDERDFEFIYEHTLPSLRDYTIGSATVTDGISTVAFSYDAKIATHLVVGDELIIGKDGQTQAIPDVDYQYPIIKSIDSISQVTLESPFVLEVVE